MFLSGAEESCGLPVAGSFAGPPRGPPQGPMSRCRLLATPLHGNHASANTPDHPPQIRPETLRGTLM